jgi:hypothetical protein
MERTTPRNERAKACSTTLHSLLSSTLLAKKVATSMRYLLYLRITDTLPSSSSSTSSATLL